MEADPIHQSQPVNETGVFFTLPGLAVMIAFSIELQGNMEILWSLLKFSVIFHWWKPWDSTVASSLTFAIKWQQNMWVKNSVVSLSKIYNIYKCTVPMFYAKKGGGGNIPMGGKKSWSHFLNAGTSASGSLHYECITCSSYLGTGMNCHYAKFSAWLN